MALYALTLGRGCENKDCGQKIAAIVRWKKLKEKVNREGWVLGRRCGSGASGRGGPS